MNPQLSRGRSPIVPVIFQRLENALTLVVVDGVLERSRTDARRTSTGGHGFIRTTVHYLVSDPDVQMLKFDGDDAAGDPVRRDRAGIARQAGALPWRLHVVLARAPAACRLLR